MSWGWLHSHNVSIRIKSAAPLGHARRVGQRAQLRGVLRSGVGRALKLDVQATALQLDADVRLRGAGRGQPFGLGQFDWHELQGDSGGGGAERRSGRRGAHALEVVTGEPLACEALT